MSNKNYMTVPRFYNRQWSGGLGWVLFISGAAMTALMIWSLPGETDIVMAVVTVLAAIVSAAVTLVGLRTLLTPLDKVRFSPDGVEIRLFGIRMKRISHKAVRSIIGDIREYRSGLKDHQIYTLKLNYEDPRGKERTILLERTALADEAINTYLSDATILL